MKARDTRLGIALMVLTTAIFALQDALSRHLSAEYNVLMVVMLRYWFFAGFVLLLAMRRGGIAQVARTHHPALQIIRGVLLVAEICVTVTGFVLLGLVETHAVFAIYPLVILILAGPLLGERLSPRVWLAVFVGITGVLMILRPGFGVFSPLSLIPLAAAFMFALYGILTRYVSRRDSAQTSLFWTGIAGALAITIIGLRFWQDMRPVDWGLMGLLSASGVLGHGLLIRVYDLAEASAVQPYASLQLVFASALGVALFGDRLALHLVIGAAVVVLAGILAYGDLSRNRA